MLRDFEGCVVGRLYAGCDEAGRGALAGPVVAAAVLLPDRFCLPQLDDSKKLSVQRRTLLAVQIKREALAWAVGEASAQEVDRCNVLQASFLAMHRAIEALLAQHRIDHLLIDGHAFKPYGALPHTCVIRGDARIPAIAAASVLAKTHRDDLVTALATRYPRYGWHRNKGYPTRLHRAALRVLGCTPYHRRSFAPCQGACDSIPGELVGAGAL